MKNLRTIAIAILAFTSVTVSAQTKKINVTKSNVSWVGKKIGGQHQGTVNFQDGNIVLKSGKLTGGSFTVDMNSITVTDIQGKGKENLEGHLKNDDFFATDKFSTATIVFKTIADKGKGVYTVTADLTIKGKTNPVKFDIAVGANSATAKFNIDRAKYDVKYGSGTFFSNLGDKTIDDEFEVVVNLVF